MPLVFEKALERLRKINESDGLRELGLSGFVKYVARNRCENSPIRQVRIDALKQSLKKQMIDVEEASTSIQKLEALADLRNVAGLLFLEIEEELEEVNK